MLGAWFREQSEAAEFVVAAKAHGKRCEVSLISPALVYDHGSIHRVLFGHDFVVLPLSLPDFASLWLVELANKLDSSARLILMSYTDADRDALRELYDGFCHPQENFIYVLNAIEQPSTRTRDLSRRDQL